MIKEFTTKGDLNSYISPMVIGVGAGMIASAAIGGGAQILGGLFGGGEAEAPEMSKTEKALYVKQQTILDEISSGIDTFSPFILSEMGLTGGGITPWHQEKISEIEADIEKMSAGGFAPSQMAAAKKHLRDFRAEAMSGIRRMTEDERVAIMSPSEKKLYENYNLKLDRERLALEGKLPVSEGSQQRYADAKKEFELRKSRELGPNWRTSSPGSKALKDFESGWRATLDAERRGDIATVGAGIESTAGLLRTGRAERIGQYEAFPTRKGGLIGAYGQVAQPYQDYNIAGYQSDLYSQQLKAGKTAGLIETGGYLVGKAFDYYAGGGRVTGQPVPKRKAGLLDTTNRTLSRNYGTA